MNEKMNEKKQVRFWNGNKSQTRRDYEKQLLALCLHEAGIFDADIVSDECDYPSAEDEGNIFSRDCDVLISVAGNQKFADKATNVIHTPVCRGILGHRLLIIPKKQALRFAKLDNMHDLQKLTVGIPATWADADLFRQNGFSVSEKGNLDELFTRLLEKQFDYIALGANEVESIFEQFNGSDLELFIEPNILIYYPLPLVFYIHPDRKDLANLLERGLNTAIENGKHEALFEAHHPKLIERLALRTRTAFQLSNAYLPISMQNFRPIL